VTDTPDPLKAEIEQMVARPLPADVAGWRMRLLAEHADSVAELLERARRVYREMLDHEVEVMRFDGMPPRLAEQAAGNNLGVRQAELDQELAEAIRREDERLRRRLRALIEDLEEEGG